MSETAVTYLAVIWLLVVLIILVPLFLQGVAYGAFDGLGSFVKRSLRNLL